MALLCILFSTVVFLVWDLRNAIPDDAYIYLKIADNLISGHGWAFNSGNWVNAATSPFYEIFLAGIVALHLPGAVTPLVVATSVGFCGFGAAVYFGSRKLGRLGAFCLALGAATFSPLLITSGLEISLFLACIGWTAFAYQERRYLLAGFLAGLTALGRPEGVVILPILVAIGYLRRDPPPWKMIAVFFVPILPWVIFEYAAFHTVIPHTLLVKSAQSGTGPWAGSWLWSFLRQLRPLKRYWGYPLDAFVVVCAPLGFVLGMANFRERPFYPIIFAFGFVQVAGYTIFKAPTNYFWYYAPGDAVFILSILLACVHGVRALSAQFRAGMVGYRSGIGLVAAIYLFFVLAIRPPLTYTTPRSAQYEAISRWLQKNSSVDDWVASDEIGYLGYYSHRNIRDMLGLLNRSALVALKNGRWDWWFTEYPEPRFIVTHSPRWIGEPGYSRGPWREESQRRFEQNYRSVYNTGGVQLFERKR